MRRFLCLPVLLLVLSGCSSHALKENPDPYESLNRKTHTFNDGMFRYVVKPVSRAYRAVLPTKARNGIYNFFENIDTVPAMANDALQARFYLFWHHTVRLVLNSTLGVFGLFDVAKEAGFKPIQQNFGVTLATWGYEDSAYLVLPFYGPSTVRDTLGKLPDWYTKPTSYIEPEKDRYIVQGFDAMQSVSRLVPRYESLTQNALDPYVAVRNAYLQNRSHLIEVVRHNGAPPPKAEQHDIHDMLDEWDDEEWDE